MSWWRVTVTASGTDTEQFFRWYDDPMTPERKANIASGIAHWHSADLDDAPSVALERARSMPASEWKRQLDACGERLRSAQAAALALQAVRQVADRCAWPGCRRVCGHVGKHTPRSEP